MTRKNVVAHDFTAELKTTTGESNPISVPLHVFLGEAVDLAIFVSDYWKSVTDGDALIRPGLDRAGKKLRPTIRQEILTLVELVQRAQTDVLLATRLNDEHAQAAERARKLVADLDAIVAWAFDDGITDDRDVQLEAIRTQHADTGDSVDALAARLEDYVGLSAKYAAELADLPDHDPDSIAEGRELARTLRAIPAARGEATKAAEAARLHRNQLLALLVRRVNLVRAAARFVFRDQPEIARKATSLYERRRRSANEKKKPQEPTG